MAEQLGRGGACGFRPKEVVIERLAGRGGAEAPQGQLGSGAVPTVPPVPRPHPPAPSSRRDIGESWHSVGTVSGLREEPRPLCGSNTTCHVPGKFVVSFTSLLEVPAGVALGPGICHPFVAAMPFADQSDSGR